MEKEVHVPFVSEANRDVRLSTLYQLCPELFAAEITPLNDSTVTLPPRLGLSSPASHASDPAPASARATSATTGSRASDANGANAAANNPFWSPVSALEPKAETAKPIAMKDETPQPAAGNPKPWPTGPKGAGDNPFSSQTQSAGTPAVASGPAVSGAPNGMKIGGGFDAPPSSAGTEAGGKSFAGGSHGFETSPPASVFGAGGSDGLREPVDEKSPVFSDNPFESKHGFTTLFSKGAAADSGIPFPSAPVSGEKLEEPQGVWGTMFHGGAVASAGAKSESADTSPAPPVFEGFGSMISKASEAQESTPWGNFSAPFAGDSPFESVPEIQTPVAQPLPEPVSGKGQGMEFAVFEPFPVPVEPEVAPVAKKAVPEVSWTIEPTASKPVPVPRIEDPVQTPASNGAASPVNAVSGFTSVRSQAEAPAPQPVPETVAPAPFALKEVVEVAPSAVSPPPSADHAFDLKDLELKAIFSTSEPFTLSKVARRVVGLPGISSCALSTPGKLVQASRSEESRIGNEAREMVTTLRNLAKLTGLPEARTFTLHTDRGIVSLFLEGECCVTVHHESAAFPPGVREKLILVARSLINLED